MSRQLTDKQIRSMEARGIAVCRGECGKCGRKICTGAAKIRDEGKGNREEGGTLNAERSTLNAQGKTGYGE